MLPLNSSEMTRAAGRMLRDARRMRGVSIPEACSATGVHVARWIAFERGDADLTAIMRAARDLPEKPVRGALE